MSQVFYSLNRVINGIALLSLVAMMCLTASDVFMRYVLNRPILGSYEITELMMAVLVALTLAYTQLNKGHVNIEVLTSHFSSRTRAILYIAVYAVSLGVFILISWRSTSYALSMLQSKYATSALNIPIYPFAFVFAFGSAMLCVVFIFDLLEYLKTALGSFRWQTFLALMVLVAATLMLIAAPVWGRRLIWQIHPFAAGLFSIGLLIALLFSGMQIGIVMALLGFLGIAYIAGVTPGLTTVGTSPYSEVSSYSLSVVPLFVLMGAFSFHSGMSQKLYYAMYKLVGHFPGGLAMTTVAACAGFAAVCGSSIATVATMGTVALPEMKKYKYDTSLATGCIAAGGTIGILIPPSVILVIYGVLTEESIGKLFAAGFIPGVLEAVFYMITIYILCVRNPQLGPRGESSNWMEKISALKGAWPVAVLFLLVIGGLYLGVFTPAEAAGVGAFAAFLFALGTGNLTWKRFSDGLSETGKTTAMTFLILIGATIFGYFLAISRLPFELSSYVAALSINRYLILGIILVIYLLLGAIISSLAVVVLTVPIFFPVITALGFDPIWFGIIIVRMVEIGQITPPVGINVFVMQGIAKDVPMYTIFRGIVPFLVADFLHVALLVAFPQLSLFLPSLMK